MATPFYLQYRELERQLCECRLKHGGADSPEEEEILGEMDYVWYKIPQDEHDLLNSEPPKSVIA